MNFSTSNHKNMIFKAYALAGKLRVGERMNKQAKVIQSSRNCSYATELHVKNYGNQLNSVTFNISQHSANHAEQPTEISIYTRTHANLTGQ
jgi:hypothetical protein